MEMKVEVKIEVVEVEVEVVEVWVDGGRSKRVEGKSEKDGGGGGGWDWGGGGGGAIGGRGGGNIEEEKERKRPKKPKKKLSVPKLDLFLVTKYLFHFHQPLSPENENLALPQHAYNKWVRKSVFFPILFYSKIRKKYYYFPKTSKLLFKTLTFMINNQNP